MALSNCMALVAAGACSTQVLTPISLHAHPTPTHKTIFAAQLSAGRAGTQGRGNTVKAAAAAKKNEEDGGKGKLEEEDMMELEFGRMLGESPHQTLKKILIRKSHPSVNYVDIEKSARRPDKSPSWSFSTVDVSEVAIKDHRQLKDPKSSSEANLPELLRPVSRPNTYAHQSHAPIRIVAVPQKETHDSELSLIPKPVPIKQRDLGTPPPQPELNVIPPVMTQKKYAPVVVNQHTTESSAGLSLHAPMPIRSPALDVPDIKHLQAMVENDTSVVDTYLLPKPLAPLSGQTEVQARGQQHNEELSESGTAATYNEEDMPAFATKSDVSLKQELSSSHPHSSPTSSCSLEDTFTRGPALESSITGNLQSSYSKNSVQDVPTTPVLSSKPTAPNRSFSVKGEISIQEPRSPKEVIASSFVSISQRHLANIDEHFPAQSMSENVSMESLVGVTPDQQGSTYAEVSDLHNEKIIIKDIKESTEFHKPIEKRDGELGGKTPAMADKVPHSSDSMNEHESTMLQSPPFSDGSSERHLEEKNPFLEELVPSVTDSAVPLIPSRDSKDMKQISQSDLLDNMLRKPTLDSKHRKARDLHVHKQIVDTMADNKVALYSKNNIDSIVELKYTRLETLGGLKQQESQINPVAEANIQHLARQPNLSSIASPDLPLQKRPDHNEATENELPPNVANENEDRDWAQTEAFKCAKAIVEAKLISSNSGGVMALVGAVVGFLPAKELAFSRGLRSFAVWACEKGYNIPKGKLTEDIKQTSNEFGDGRGNNEPGVELIMPNEMLFQVREVPKGEQGSLPPQDGKEALAYLQTLYRREKVERLASLVGQKAKVVITFVDRSTKRVLLSEAKAYEDSSDALKKKTDLMGTLKVGDVVTCTVKNFASFGIFVDLQGVLAFIHQSELSWNPKVTAASFLHINQEIQAVVADLNYNLQRINLSIKRLQTDPLFETLESLSAAKTDFTQNLFDSPIGEDKGTVVPELESLYRRLEESDEINQVLKGRRIKSKTFAPNFQVYLSTPLDGGYKLLARFGNEVQEIFVKSEADKEILKQVISSSTLLDDSP